ncbi:MAG: hypothetical protein KDN19_04875 [Verrucomicrobiae bacterium]|nr:hypothetical protein [Verrucomicrobiae bacterium]
MNSEPGITILHRLGESLRELMVAIPMPVVRGIFVGLLLLLLLWVLRLPRERVRPPAEVATGWSSNLKLWAAVALGIQALIYLVF